MQTSLIRSFCTRCSFASFCIEETENAHRTKQASPIVKQHRVLKRNEVLCLPKNKFQNLYAIQRGALKTYQVEANGKELIRGFYFAGEMLGYEAIHTNHYPFSAVALFDTLICEIPYTSFLEFLQNRPAVQKRVLSLISQQLNAGSYLASTSAEQRLTAFILDLSVRLHSEVKLEFVLPMSRQDMGNYLRLTAETISRLLSRLQKSQIIAIQHKKIRILQLEKLQEIANGLSSVFSMESWSVSL